MDSVALLYLLCQGDMENRIIFKSQIADKPGSVMNDHLSTLLVAKQI